MRVALRPRSFVRVSGPDAAAYLERMVSNEVASLPEGGVADALLLTAKARVIAPLRVWRRAPDDFLLLTEPELGETVRSCLLKTRFAAKCDVELEEHTAHVVFGGAGIRAPEYGEPAAEVLDGELEATVSAEELERLRIEAGAPAWAKEIDDRVLPAEAGLTETHVAFGKGCYPGQEPIARLHYRGHANRGLRVLHVDGVAERDADVVFEGKPVGRVTSSVEGVALAYVRREVPADADLDVGGAVARQSLRRQTEPGT
jgi:folate-binding protein YgfZ